MPTCLFLKKNRNKESSLKPTLMQWTEQRGSFLDRLPLWPSVKTQFCFKGKRLIKIILVILRQTEREPQSCLCGRRRVRTSPAKPIPCLGIKNNALLLGPHLLTPGRILILLGIPPKYSLAKQKKGVKIIFRNQCPPKLPKAPPAKGGEKKKEDKGN